MGYGVPMPQQEGAWFLGPLGSSGHYCEADIGSRAGFAEETRWGINGLPLAPRGRALDWVFPHKRRLRGTSEGPLRWEDSGFLAVSPSQGWGRSPVRVIFRRETEKAGTQCSGPASGLCLFRSAFIGKKR